ncbi:MAG: hypothetical protein HC897_07755, partial [Thermoanaerobaculia bacterium]|nr:hypothetical protein [Thermoanaerobaculia bacterium]
MVSTIKASRSLSLAQASCVRVPRSATNPSPVPRAILDHETHGLARIVRQTKRLDPKTAIAGFERLTRAHGARRRPRHWTQLRARQRARGGE